MDIGDTKPMEIYTRDSQTPGRFYVTDHLVIFGNIELFKIYSQAYHNLSAISNCSWVREKAHTLGCDFKLVPESAMTCNLIYNHLDGCIRYHQGIPNFM